MRSVAYRYLRLKAAEYGLFPDTKLGRLTLAFVVIDLFLVVLRRLLDLFQWSMPAGEALPPWIVFLTILVILFGTIVTLRWIRRYLLWRLRNRLIVTYMFIGLIPIVLLLSMVGLAGYLFAGQFGTYVVTAELRSETRALSSARHAVEHELKTDPSGVAAVVSSIEERFPLATIVAWNAGKPTVLHAPPASAEITMPAWVEPDHSFTGLALEKDQLSLRSFNRFGDTRAVVVSIPIDRAWLEQVASDLGRVSIYDIERSRNAPKQQGGVNITIKEDNGEQVAGEPKILLSGGALPPGRGRWDTASDFITPLRIDRWDDGKREYAYVRVRTRPSLLYAKLFASLGKDADAVMIALVGIAIFFGIIELFALFIGVGLTRSITRSVAALYRGTEHVNRGNFHYRIKVRGKDQLAELENSFNSMTANIEKLIAEQKEKERLQSELAIAQEVQDQLFPHQDIALSSLEVHGVCRAARMVSGDYYDFVPFGPHELGIAVGDISGKGISAALLMATVHSAVRAYELIEQNAAVAVAHGSAMTVEDGRFSPAETMSVLNRHLYRSTPAEKYATLFLGIFNGTTRTLTYANAGHLPPLIVGQDGDVRKLNVGGLVVGLFDNQAYDDQRIQLRPGDIFLAYSDGVTEPENEFGEFGEGRLLEIVREHRREPLAHISQAVTTAVQDWIGANEQPDDITVVLARVR